MKMNAREITLSIGIIPEYPFSSKSNKLFPVPISGLNKDTALLAKVVIIEHMLLRIISTMAPKKERSGITASIFRKARTEPKYSIMLLTPSTNHTARLVMVSTAAFPISTILSTTACAVDLIFSQIDAAKELDSAMYCRFRKSLNFTYCPFRGSIPLVKKRTNRATQRRECAVDA